MPISSDLLGRIGLLCSTDGRWPGPYLTPRECEIVRLVAKDHSNKEIGRVLAISPHTVASHLRNVFLKFGVRSKAAMVATVLELLAHRGKSGLMIGLSVRGERAAGLRPMQRKRP